MIRKINSGYQVISDEGKLVATYKSQEQAIKRLEHIEFFKYKEALEHL